MGVDQPPAIKRPDSDYFCGFLKDAEGGSFARLCTCLVLAFLLTQRRKGAEGRGGEINVKYSAYLCALRGYFSCQKVQNRNRAINQHT